MTLQALMQKHGSDKAEHGYCEFYERRFAPFRESATAVMEIGVYRGASLRAWLEYFPNAHIYGIDDGAWQKKWDLGTGQERATVLLSDQSSRGALACVTSRLPEQMDLVLDDGGHTMWGQQVSLGTLIHTVKPGGLYVVEDLFSSFQTIMAYRNRDGSVAQAYASGCDYPLTTTHDVLDNWPDVKSDYMTQDEWDALVAKVADVEIFDRDGDHNHSTAVLEVKDD